jgi:UDP-2,4-diacetamido-2,4,6-trideoxy-beta-L-altropyranose hydrolase
MKHFVFRLDANARIGTGHLMRCLTIANELDQNLCSCHFICSELIQPLRSLITDKGYKYYLEDSENGVLAILKNINPEYLVIDHYGLDTKFESKAYAFSKRILVIEDMANRTHFCDLLLDQSPLRSKADYKQIINPDCKLLLGPDYALIRPKFRQLRKSKITSWKKGLISFGGSDPYNITLLILKTLDSQLEVKKIKWTIIAGAANKHWKSLKDFTKYSQMDITLIKQTNQIAMVMANHDFAIGAAGSMAWERSCIGLPSLTIPIEDNQRVGIEHIKHFSLGQTLEVSEITATTLVMALKQLKHQANDYLERNQTMVDGLGVARLMKMLSLN